MGLAKKGERHLDLSWGVSRVGRDNRRGWVRFLWCEQLHAVCGKDEFVIGETHQAPKERVKSDDVDGVEPTMGGPWPTCQGGDLYSKSMFEGFPKFHPDRVCDVRGVGAPFSSEYDF